MPREVSGGTGMSSSFCIDEKKDTACHTVACSGFLRNTRLGAPLPTYALLVQGEFRRGSWTELCALDPYVRMGQEAEEKDTQRPPRCSEYTHPLPP